MVCCVGNAGSFGNASHPTGDRSLAIAGTTSVDIASGLEAPAAILALLAEFLGSVF